MEAKQKNEKQVNIFGPGNKPFVPHDTSGQHNI